MFAITFSNESWTTEHCVDQGIIFEMKAKAQMLSNSHSEIECKYLTLFLNY